MSNPTNTTGIKPAVLTLEALQRAKELIDAMPPAELTMDHIATTHEIVERMRVMTKVPPLKTTHGVLGSFYGVNIIIDPNLPAGVIEARNHEGKVLERWVL